MTRNYAFARMNLSLNLHLRHADFVIITTTTTTTTGIIYSIFITTATTHHCVFPALSANDVSKKQSTRKYGYGIGRILF